MSITAQENPAISQSLSPTARQRQGQITSVTNDRYTRHNTHWISIQRKFAQQSEERTAGGKGWFSPRLEASPRFGNNRWLLV